MSDKVQMQCPKCGGQEMWDNRLTKKNPKAPDFKCVDKSCDGVVWPPKPGPAAPYKPNAVQPHPTGAPAANGKQGYTAGPPIAGLDDDDLPLPHEKLDRLFSVWDSCLAHAHVQTKHLFGADVTDEAVIAATATLFIQACRVGV